MQVYVAVFHFRSGGSELVGVFLNEDDAVKAKPKDPTSFGHLTVDETTVR